MFKRLSLLVCALTIAGAARADVMTKKFDWAPVGGIQKLDLQMNDIAISQVRFDLGDTISPIRVSSAKAVVRVDNNSQIDQEVGVAIAVFDGDGNLVAAGDGGNKVGELNRGDREEFTVRFGFVYRNLASAKTFLLTLETKPKGTKKKSGKWTPKPTATP